MLWRDNLHSRLVAGMKILLPLAALGMLSTLFLISERFDPGEAVPPAAIELRDRARDEGATNAALAGVTRGGHEVLLRAARFVPSVGTIQVIQTVITYGGLFAAIAMEIGSFILGTPHIALPGVLAAFSNASVELWRNFNATFTPEVMHWGRLSAFFEVVFLPYLVGGLLPGLIAGIAAYFLSNPVIIAYQKARIKRQRMKYEKRRAREARRASKALRKSADPAE